MRTEGERTPGSKLLLAILVAAALAIPLFSIWLLVYDRQTQSEQATASITEGWGGSQIIGGPVLVIPYRATTTDTIVDRGQSITRSREVTRELTLSPEAADLSTTVSPERRKRSIYEAVVYDAKLGGSARFAFHPISPGTASRSRTWTLVEPSCASASAIRAASAPIPKSSPTGLASGFNRAAEAAVAGAFSPGSTRATSLRSRSPSAINMSCAAIRR